MTQDEESKQAKIAALRNLRDKGFYEPKTDNPEGLDLDSAPPTPGNSPTINVNQVGQGLPPSPSPTPNTEQTMQQNPQNLIDALKQKSRQQQLQDLMDAARQ